MISFEVKSLVNYKNAAFLVGTCRQGEYIHSLFEYLLYFILTCTHI